ncbi:MAG: glucose-6-phosphate isomerase [Planctomycetota bacterium]
MKGDGPVRFDYTNLLSESVGSVEHGITMEEIEGLAEAVREGHNRLAAKRARGELGFYDLPDGKVEGILREAQRLTGKVRDVVVLGIGGSALGTSAAAQALLNPYHNVEEKARGGHPRLFVLDNIDPRTLAATFETVDLERSLWVVVTKSGSTAETMAQFGIAAKRLKDALGKRYAERIVAITDGEKGDLRRIAREEGFTTFDVPGNVGGRYSVLSAVGLFPAALAGADVAGLLAGARRMRERTGLKEVTENPAYFFAASQYLLATRKGKPISVMMPYSDALVRFADWYVQLWAESLGKKEDRAGRIVHVGPTPVGAVGATDQHSQVQLFVEGPKDKVVTFLAVDEETEDLACEVPYSGCPALEYLAGNTMRQLLDAERRGTALALAEAGRPNGTIHIARVSAETVGALFFFFETATAMSGELYDVDAFNQPGVEAGKIAAYALMGRKGHEKRLAEIQALEMSRGKKVIS